MNETIRLTFAHLTILATIGVLASAAVAFVTSRVVKAAGWKKPYTERQTFVLEWAPALVFGLISTFLFPFVYSQVVGPVSGWQWGVIGFGMGVVGGLGSKGFYAIAKDRLAPAWEEGASEKLKG